MPLSPGFRQPLMMFSLRAVRVFRYDACQRLLILSALLADIFRFRQFSMPR